MEKVSMEALFLIFPLFFCAMANKTEEGKVDDFFNAEMENFFTEMNYKPSPLFFCPIVDTGVVWQLPKPLNCEPVTNVNNSKVVVIAIYYPDLNKQIINGFECWKVVSNRKKSHFFFGSYYSQFSDVKKPVSRMECEKMVKENLSPDNDSVLRRSGGYYSTEHDTEISYQWPLTIEKEIVNYFFTDITIGINDHDETIISNSKSIEVCKLIQGNCNNLDSILIWDIPTSNKCRLRKAEKDHCLISAQGNWTASISCPTLTLTLNDIKPYKYCNNVFGLSAQGIIFSQEKKLDINEEIITIVEADKLIRSGYPRLRREMNSTVDQAAVADQPAAVEEEEYLYDYSEDQEEAQQDMRHSRTFETTATANARYQYLYDLVKEKVNYAITNLHYSVCRNSAIQLEILRALAEVGMPNIMLRAFLKDYKTLGSLRGDALLITPCKKIRYYQLLKQDTKPCTKNWPIRFLAPETNDTYIDGYLNALTKEISLSPIIVPCPPPQFVFSYQDSSYLLYPNITAINLPTLAIPYSRKPGQMLPTITFARQGIYSASDISNEHHLLKMLEEMNKKNSIDLIIQKTVLDKELSPKDQNYINQLFDILATPLKSILVIVMYVIAGIVIFILIMIVLCNIGPCISCCLSCLKNCKVKKKKSRDIEEDEFDCVAINVVPSAPPPGPLYREKETQTSTLNIQTSVSPLPFYVSTFSLSRLKRL